MRPGRGKKARCSSLTTPSSTRCGRMPRRSGWSSSWMCGTQSWPLSRDAAFLQSKRNCHSLGCAPKRLPLCCSWGAETDIRAPWLFGPLALQLKTSKVPSGWEITERSICLTAVHLGGPLLQVTRGSTDILPGLKGNTCCVYIASQRYFSTWSSVHRGYSIWRNCEWMNHFRL